MDLLMNKRTHTCGELNNKQINTNVCLNGWVNTIRLHGQVIFIDIRDRYGKTQLVFNVETSKTAFDVAKKLSIEDVISATGDVQARNKEAVNPNMETGEIEVIVNLIEILNETAPLPFVITDRDSASVLESVMMRINQQENIYQIIILWKLKHPY
jgi:aspartyl-tRNA synthetase